MMRSPQWQGSSQLPDSSTWGPRITHPYSPFCSVVIYSLIFTECASIVLHAKNVTENQIDGILGLIEFIFCKNGHIENLLCARHCARYLHISPVT